MNPKPDHVHHHHVVQMQNAENVMVPELVIAMKAMKEIRMILIKDAVENVKLMTIVMISSHVSSTNAKIHV